MRKYEFYPSYHDLFEYDGDNEIERLRIKCGRTIRRDSLVFDNVEEAYMFFRQRCGAFVGRYDG